MEINLPLMILSNIIPKCGMLWMYMRQDLLLTPYARSIPYVAKNIDLSAKVLKIQYPKCSVFYFSFIPRRGGKQF